MRRLDWISGTRFLCFMALQGESLELENVLSDFKNVSSSFLLMCPLCQKSSDSKYRSHSCYEWSWVVVNSWDGGINHPFDVWWLKKKKKKKKLHTSWIFWFSNVQAETALQAYKIELNSFGNWAEITFIQIQMCLFQVSSNHHCRYTVRTDQCSQINVLFGTLL